jgi:AraC-like DNA-binding protein
MTSDSDVRFLQLPHLPEVEVRYSHYRKSIFHKHSHHTYAVGVILQGETLFTLWTGGQALEISAGQGDVVFIHPGQVHACNPRPGVGFAYYMIYIQPSSARSIWQAGDASRNGTLAFEQPLVKDAWLFQELSEQSQRIFSHRDDESTSDEFRKLLAEVIYLYGMGSVVEGGAVDDRLETSRQYILNHILEDLRLEQLAELSGLSQYHYVREFHRAYGLPPHTYQLQERIHLAGRMLKADLPITQVAQWMGFADQSHFSRRFKALMGATPGQYQKLRK